MGKKRNFWDDIVAATPTKKAKKGGKTKKKKKKKTAADLGGPLTLAHTDAASPEKKLTKFKHFRAHKSIVEILKAEGKSKMFEIQRATFDTVFDGKDLLARAHTGSGKTLAFAVPIVSVLLNEGRPTMPGEGIRVLCLAPTRELAMQVETVFKKISKGLSTFCIYGGTAYGPQLEALRGGLDILVGTCGRVKDLLSTQRIRLERCKHIILDEADQMLDIGFADDIEEILGYMSEVEAAQRQVVLFSATIPGWVQSIAERFMRGSPVVVDLTQDIANKSSGTITHQCLQCNHAERAKVLGDILLTHVGPKDRVIVFADMKMDCNELAMSEYIKQECQVLHGDIAQKQREVTTEGFRQGRFPILIATDVAARGLDISGVQLVIHLMPPNPEKYIHRSGRTGRAGQSGKSIVLFTANESRQITIIEKQVGVKLTRIGAPQAKDIAGVVSLEAMRLLDEVPDTICALFGPHAEKAVANSKRTPTELLAASFAVVSGYTKESEDRSLLSSTPGYTTLQLNFSRETERWQAMNKLHYDFPHVAQRVKNLHLSKDRMQAVFDVPNKMLEDCLEEDQLELCKDLPELMEEINGGRRGRGRGGRRRGGFFGRSGGFSSRRNSFGRGRRRNFF